MQSRIFQTINNVLFKDRIISVEQDKLVFEIADNVEKYIKANNIQEKTKILYIPTYYQIKYTRIFDICMALSFKLRGCQIIPVITGDFYKDEDVIFGGIYNKNRDKQIQKYDLIEKKIWKDLLKTNYCYLPNFQTDRDVLTANKISERVNITNYNDCLYQGYPVGNQANIVTLNMNNMPELENDPEILRQLRTHVSNIIQLMHAYKRIIDKIQPDIIFSNVPFYYKWSIPYYIAKNQGIPFYSAMMGERKNAYLFSLNSDQMLDSSPAWNSFKEQEISEATKSQMGYVIDERIRGHFAHFTPYPKQNTENEETKKLFSEISKGKPLVFFPVNISFDAAVFRDSPAFDNLNDMINNVISFFNANEQFQLIIKAHPAETLFYNNSKDFSKYCLKNIIGNLDSKLHKNIIFLDYDSSISTYDIIPKINLGIVYTSTSAMEMSWFGKPVIAVADSHYQSKGFTYQPKSKEDFFFLINKVLSTKESNAEIQKRIELSKKYYLLFYYHALVDLKLFQGSDTGGVENKLLFRDFKELLPGKNEALDYICDSIINKLPIYGENRWPPITI